MITELGSLHLSNYERKNVTNVGIGVARESFNQGLRLLLAYQHETAAEYFRNCVETSPNCALGHSLIAFCHSPNYNFRGVDYYEFSKPEPGSGSGTCMNTGNVVQAKFPCQVIADRHSRLAEEIVQKLSIPKEEENGNVTFTSTRMVDAQPIEEVDLMLIHAIRILTCNPGIHSSTAEEMNDKPFAKAMSEVYDKFPNDPDVAYIYASAIMTLHAWRLFEYPTGKPLSADITLIKDVLEKALQLHPRHVGLCHMFCHLCEMSAKPEQALTAADVLRTEFPEAGHLVHMPTHIDVLVGDYEACVRWNIAAIKADKIAMHLSPRTSNPTSFYFGYVVHNFHMLIYGGILGGMEQIAMETAEDLNSYVNEALFEQRNDLTAYLESYSTMDIHVLVRFGRWRKLLEIEFPKDQNLMLSRTAALYYGRALAFANLGSIDKAREETLLFEEIRRNPDGKCRILHNNIVSDLLDVDSAMLKGEIAYFSGAHELAFEELKRAVKLQDSLNYDEPWGKLQPIRHALGGLMLRQDLVEEAKEVFIEDLKRHPRNPWSLTGLIQCVKHLEDSEHLSCCNHSWEEGNDQEDPNRENIINIKCEVETLQRQLQNQRKAEWADFVIINSCACCSKSSEP